MPLFAVGGLGGTALGIALGLGAGDLATGAPTNLGTAIGFALASTAVWFIGRRLNRPYSVFNHRSGQSIRIGNHHRLFWVPVQHLGPVGGVLSILFAVQAVTG